MLISSCVEGCVRTKNGKSESIKQASTKVVNSRDYKTQGQSKLKEKQEQILEEPEHANLFQTHVTQMWEDAHKRAQEVEVCQEV